MLPLMSISELQLYLAESVKKERIAQRLTQKELAEKADIPLSTYRRLEQKGEGSIKDLIKIMVSLGRINDLSQLFVPAEVSPLEAYEKQTKSTQEQKRVKHGRQS